MIQEKLASLLEERFKEEDLQDCYVIEIIHGKGDKMEVYIDCDGELTLRKCQTISRYLEKHIDEHNWLGEKYTLEVSSPGLDRPLQQVRQYLKNIGRNIRIKADEDIDVTGELKVVTESGIEVEETKKKKEIITHEFAFEQIREAKIQVSFKKK